jgi:hypothetical protein
MRNHTRGGEPDSSGVPRRSSEAGLYRVPGLEELAAEPGKAGVLDMRTARIIAGKALGIFAASLYRLFEMAEINGSDSAALPAGRDSLARGGAAAPGLDDVATVEEVAAIIDKPRRWIIRNVANLPFVIRVTRKHYICSKVALQRWIASRPRSLKRP